MGSVLFVCLSNHSKTKSKALQFPTTRHDHRRSVFHRMLVYDQHLCDHQFDTDCCFAPYVLNLWPSECRDEAWNVADRMWSRNAGDWTKIVHACPSCDNNSGSWERPQEPHVRNPRSTNTGLWCCRIGRCVARIPHTQAPSVHQHKRFHAFSKCFLHCPSIISDISRKIALMACCMITYR